MTRWWFGVVACLMTHCLLAADDTGWLEESNRNARILLEIGARYFPEGATSNGVEGYDKDVVDLKPGIAERQIADLTAAVAQLQSLKAGASDARVLQDLDILITAAQSQITTLELNRKYRLTFFDLPQTIFSGFQDLLDSRVARERQKDALVRLRRYAGREKGYRPLTQLARERYEEEAAANPALIGPWIVEAQQYLDNQGRYLDGIEALLKESGLKGWQKDLRTLRRQVDEYGAWVRTTVLPHARKSSQLPAELYADNLKQFGVEMDPRELMDRAMANYGQTRSEIETVARIIAAQRGWETSDYRQVIRALKKEQIPNDKLLDLYYGRLEQIEAIVRREKIVTLPTRKAVIRLGTEAESAASPAPHIDPPRLVGNTGEPAEFVLPTSNPNAKAGAPMDDFNYDAIAWTLTAHEARPGHELQFAAMLERGVSTARVVYAFNSANVEGWALYAEALMKQYLPPEGQLGALQMRMMREARAFLDPMLNLGMMEPAAAQSFLMNEVLLSEPMAKQEVDRYTFNAPGQATSYYYGYSKLDALRTKVEIVLRDRFSEQPYHDFLIGQGLLPFDLLEKAVMEEFVPAQMK
ncbi:DUF885 domain-containing protein [Povalibacter sp.]|uniref:DUF885 domain-containing protein n=1 Tax=Povalibacter sp. TaxID=1962978 RepID=UPI002F3F864F